MKKRGLLAILFGMAVLSFGLFNSCDIDIGLGSAVDVEPPTLFIENPPASKIIRDAFPISGTYKDDGTISAITVELTNTETQVKYPKIDGTWGKENTWSATVDPIKLKIPDGKYEATITISDNGGHHSTSTRSFIIDNTAPVVVLSRPASDASETDLNKIESYGQYLTLEGQAADDNDIEKIVIKFYSKDNPDKDPIVKEITSIPPTISLDVAKFLDENDPTYTKLYGTDKNAGEKYYYCTISAFDGAKRYPAKGDEKADDDYGNEESSYILWTDWEKFQSEYSKTTGSSSKIKLPELYSIKAGKSETTQERSVSEKTLISAFFNKAITRGSFKLNPLNNPSYSISGLDIGLANDVENERPLTVQLSKGLDGLSLDTDNMKVYLIPLTIEDDGTETRGKKIYPQQSTYEKKGDGQFITVIQKDNVKDSDGNDTSLVYGTTYVIGVDGEDIEGNKIVPSFDGKEFFIRFKAKNVAPGLTVESPSSSTSYVKKGEKVLFKGTTSIPDGYPVITITCKKGEETNAKTIYSHKVTDAEKKKIEGGLIYYNWQFEVPTSGSANEFFFDQSKSEQYAFEITASMEEMPTTHSKTVMYDVENPTISIDSMYPTAEKYKDDAEDGAKEEGNYLNGLVTMKLSIIDDVSVNTTAREHGTDKGRPYFIITDTAGNIIGSKHYITTPASQSFEINTEEIASGSLSKNIKIKIFAEDRAGNSGVDIADKTKAEFEREYIVDQTTDLPVVLPNSASSLSLKFDTKQKIIAHMKDPSVDAKKNVLTAGSRLQLKLIDDDGIAESKFEISQKDADDSNVVFAVPSGDFNKTYTGTPKETLFDYQLPSDLGKYKCRLTVKDTIGNEVIKQFWLVVTGANPIVRIEKTRPDNKIVTLADGTDKTNKITNTVKIDSGYDSFKVIRQEDGYQPEVLYGSTEDNRLVDHTFIDEFTPSEGRASNKVTYTVIDENSHDGKFEFTYDVDNKAPVIEESKIVVPTPKQTESQSFRFTAIANDEAAANEVSSGIAKLQYTFDPAKVYIKEVTGVSSLSETVVFHDEDDEVYKEAFGTETEPKEGEKAIYIRAIDSVGNEGEWVSKNFTFDKSAPNVSIDSYKLTNEAADKYINVPAANSFQVRDTFDLKGKASDANGIQTFKIVQKLEGENGFEKELSISASNINTNGVWSITGLPRNKDNETKLVSGTFTYTVTAFDKTGKKSEQILTVNIDVENPLVEITGLTDSSSYGVNSLQGTAPYTFHGTAQDDSYASASGFKELFYKFTKEEIEPAEADYISYGSPNGGNWNIPMTLESGTKDSDGNAITSTKLYEGQKYLWVYGYDNAGNKSDVRHVGFMVDQAAPSIIAANVYKITSSGTSGIPETATGDTVYLNKNTSATGYTLSGKVKDVNGISKVTVDGKNATLSTSANSDGSYNWSWTNTNQQGDYTHEIVVYDKSGKNGTDGKSSTTTIHVIFDTTPPTTTNVNLDSNSDLATNNTWFKGTGDNYITGTASDVGSGIAKIEVKPDNKTEWSTLTLQNNWTYKFTINDTLTENDYTNESFHTVEVKVTDKANNVTTIPYYFRYDKTLPFAELSLDKNDQYVKKDDLANITFRGYAHDGNTIGRAVGSAEIKVKKDNVDQPDLTINVGPNSTGANYNGTAGDDFGTFSKTGLDASKYGDGIYTFTLEVKDKAGNTPSATSTLSQTMIVDKTPPQNIVSKLVVAGTNGSVEKTAISTNNPKATIQVTFTEPNIDSVYYYVDDSSVAGRTQTNAPEDDWIGMNRDNSYTGEGYKYTKAHQFGDGKGKVYIKIVDKAGNVAYATPLEYEVDTKKPDVCTIDKVWVKNDDNSLTELSGTKLINGTKPIVFSVIATDYDDNYNTSTPREKIGNSASKIKSVVIKSIGNDTTIENVTVEGPTATGVWTLTIPAAQLPASDGSVTVTVKDKFDNEKDYPALFSLDIDTLPPRFESYSLATSYDAGVVGAAGSEIQTFYMNNEENGFKLEGIAKDDRVNPNDGNGEIEKVVLTLTESGTNGKTKTLEKSDSAWTFEIENNEWKTWTGDVTGTLSVTDKAKNVVATTKTFKIVFDNVAPKAMHWADNSNKDIYFRIGNADNDKKESDATKWETGDDVGDGTTTADKANTDVGKKYSYDSWGNDSTIEIRGNFYEAVTGSGLKTIYYAIFDSDPVNTNVTISGAELTLKEAFESGKLKSKSQSSHINAIGSFAPLETTETRKVPYTAANGLRTSQEVESNFRTSLPGFNGVENYLLLVAEDYVGNRAVDDLENSNTDGNATWNSSKTYYHINKDATAPSISGSVTEGSYTNGSTGNIVVSGTARDNDGGSDLSSVSIRITDSNDEPVLIETKNEKTANTSGNTWDASIPASTFSSGVYTVYAKATDKAGNFKEVNSGTITFDNTPPTIDKDNIKFTETKETSTTNVYKSGSTYYLNNTTTAGKTFKLSGLAQDNLAVDSVNITVKNNAGTVVESLSQEKPTNGTWDFTIGNWSSLTTGATIVIDAKDKAGNTLEAPVQFAVKFDINEPDVDSEKLKVPEPSDTEKNLFKFEGEDGSVTDSGIAGTLSGFNKVEFAFTKENKEPTASTYKETATVDSNGAWSSNVEFKKQALQSVFGNSTTSDEGKKYLWVRAYDNAGNVSGWKSKDFVYDTETPKISFSATVDNETTHITTNPTADSWRKYGFDLKVNASDSYGVKKVEVEYGTTKVDITNSASNGIYSKSFKVGNETGTSTKLDDGSYTFKVIVTDESEKTNYVTRSFKIDTTAPAVGTKTLENDPDHSEGENTVGWYMTNQIPVKVTVSDGSGSGVTSVQVSTETEVKDGVTVLKNPTSLILSGTSWSGTIVCKEQGLNTIYIKATDATGNSNVISSSDSIPVNIDTTAPLAPVFLGAGTTSASEITSLLVNKKSDVTVYAALKDAGDSDKQTGIASSAAFVQKNQTGTSSSVTLATILAFTPEWTSNHDYSEGNVVKHTEGENTKLYSCTSEHKSGTTFDTSKWTDLSGYAIWSYEIKKEDMTNGGINFTVKDNAGNTADYTLFQMVVDTDKPTVSFNDISNLNIERASTDPTVYVNGTITLSGSANDNQKLSSLTVKYKKHDDADEDSKWTTIAPPANASLSSWSRTLNTTSLDDETEYDIRVIATDAAGWTSTPVTNTVKVSQDTDRPVVTLTNIDLTEAIFGNNEIYGNVSDDDGVPASISYYIGSTKPTTSTTWTSPKANSDFTYTNGSLKLKLADGPQKIWFKVNDGKKDYISSALTTCSTDEQKTEILKSLKIVDSKNYQFGYIPKTGTTIKPSAVSTIIDTTSPKITTMEWAYSVTTGTQNWQSISNKATTGGTGSKKSINIHVYAFDINDVDTIKLKVPKNTSDTGVSGYSTADADNDDNYYIYNFTPASESDTDATKTEDGITYTKWTSATITATGMESGLRECKLEVFDGAKTTTETVSITIDNTPAEFEFTSHKDNQTVYGIKDIEVKGNVTASDMNYVYYYLTKDDVTTADDAKTRIGSNWKKILFENNKLSAGIKFDDDIAATTITGVTHEKRLRQWLKDLYEVSDIDSHNDTEVLKLWVYVVDKMENSSEPKALSLNVIPNGDKPVVKITYPDDNAKLGGTIRFSGETTIETNSVEKVYAQIIVPTSIDNSNDDWVTKLDKLIEDTKNKSTGSEPYYRVVNITSTLKGIEVSGTPTSWNFAINSHHELEKENATPDYTVNIIAKSASGKISDTVSRTVQIDKNAPSLSDMQLVKLKNETAANKFAESNIDKRITYKEDMWISGQWYLIGSVTDGNGVKQLLWHDGSASHTLVEGNNSTNTGTINNSESDKVVQSSEHTTHYTEPTEHTITAYDYDFRIPIGEASGYGTITYKISAVDATAESNSVERTITVNYDCTSPDFKATVSADDNAVELSGTGNKVQNSSGMYSVYGTFDEEGKQSGFERIAMYFTRTIGNTTNVLDPLVTKDRSSGTNDKHNNYYLSTGFQYTSVASHGDGIYWKELTATKTESDTITVSVSDDWIRKGGICKVDGVIYKIKTVTTTTITVDGTLTTSNSSKKIYVTPALVIDNLSPESKKQGATYNGLYQKNVEDTTVISGGDGDWLIEGVTKQTNSYPWSASLNSQNMLDGPVTIHFVAFDKAGNATEKSYSGNVANNAPRLAGVTVWTDYNGNGKGWRNSGDHAADYEDETKSRYYSRVHPIVNNIAMDRSNAVTSKLIASGNQNDAEGIAATSSTAFMKVTDTVKFIPEIVGGNGALYYEYKIGKQSAFTVDTTTKEITKFEESTTAGSKTKKSSAKAAITKDDGTTSVSGTDDGQDVPTATDSNSVTYVNGNTDSVITFDGATILGALDNSTSDDPTWFDVVISDSTEGDTKLSCEMQIALQINYTDETSPVVKIRPFYWNSKTNNSVIWATNGNPEGHIELEGDLPTSFAAETGVNDRDPKVSGKIKLEGYAYDDIKLKELYVKFDNHTKLNADDFKVADYTPSQQTKWTAVTHDTNDGWDFSAEDVYCNGNGHLVHWTLTIDTAARTTVAATDQAVVVYAKDDRGGHTSGHDSTTAQTSITTKRWGEVTSQEKASANYYEDFYYNTKVTDSTPDTALVYKGPDSYIWKNVKAQPNAKTIYYTDFYCGTNATDTTSDNTVVYKDTLSYRYKMDIVPYVTEIVTHLSPYSVSTPSVYARTALGNYPVYEGETIQFKGFNIGTNDAKVTIPGMTETTLTNGTVNNESGQPNTITLTTGTGRGASSGNIILKVNNIPALNNTNKDDAKGNYSGDIADSNYANGYNRQPNGVNNNLLNDDISLDVWQFLNAAEPRNGKSDNPTMKISSQGRIGISYSNAVVYFSAPFIDNADQQRRGNIKSQTAIAQNYGWFTNNTFCFDPYGYPYAAAQSPDTDNSKGAAYLQFFSRKAGKNITDMGLNENYQKIANSSRIEAICIPINKDENDWTTDIDRTQSISMTATMPNPDAAPGDNNKVTIHMAYWDNLTKQIRYRQGQVGANPESFGFVGNNDYDGNMRNYGGSLLDLQGRRSAQQEAGGRYESVYDSISSKFTDGNTNNRSAAIKAQKIYRVAGKSIGSEYADAYQVTTDKHGGKYVDIGVLPSTAKTTPRVVICWYDADAKRLVVSYDTPSNNDAKDATGMCNGDWQTNAQYIGTKGGMYCRMAIDGDDGIHIAHYDYLGADLLYTYIPSVNSVPQITSAQTFVVDSYLSVGTWCTIDVAKELKPESTNEYNYVPQIGYFAPASEDSTAAARIAKAAKFDANGRPLFAGVENDKFTGAWEISVIPTQSIPIIDRVNVGMYKDANGVLGVIPTGGENRISVSEVKKPGYPVSDSTTVYGNGTTNPAVVYCLDDGPVELAQKK